MKRNTCGAVLIGFPSKLRRRYISMFFAFFNRTRSQAMPILNVMIAATPDDALASQVSVALTNATAEILRKKRELTAVVVTFVEPTQWFIGGVSLGTQSQKSFSVNIKVTLGTNTKDEKAQFVHAVFTHMEGFFGACAAASYVVVEEVSADAWGYSGKTQEFRYVASQSIQNLTQ
jgi:4-oxalocrotonate tautomerase